MKQELEYISHHEHQDINQSFFRWRSVKFLQIKAWQLDGGFSMIGNLLPPSNAIPNQPTTYVLGAVS